MELTVLSDRPRNIPSALPPSFCSAPSFVLPCLPFFFSPPTHHPFLLISHFSLKLTIMTFMTLFTSTHYDDLDWLWWPLLTMMIFVDYMTFVDYNDIYLCPQKVKPNNREPRLQTHLPGAGDYKCQWNRSSRTWLALLILLMIISSNEILEKSKVTFFSPNDNDW